MNEMNLKLWTVKLYLLYLSSKQHFEFQSEIGWRRQLPAHSKCVSRHASLSIVGNITMRCILDSKFLFSNVVFIQLVLTVGTRVYERKQHVPWWSSDSSAPTEATGVQQCVRAFIFFSSFGKNSFDGISSK